MKLTYTLASSMCQCQRSGEKQRNGEQNNLLVPVDRLYTFRQTCGGPGSLVDGLDKEADPLLIAWG